MIWTESSPHPRQTSSVATPSLTAAQWRKGPAWSLGVVVSWAKGWGSQERGWGSSGRSVTGWAGFLLVQDPVGAALEEGRALPCSWLGSRPGLVPSFSCLSPLPLAAPRGPSPPRWPRCSRVSRAGQPSGAMFTRCPSPDVGKQDGQEGQR